MSMTGVMVERSRASGKGTGDSASHGYIRKRAAVSKLDHTPRLFSQICSNSVKLRVQT